MNILSSLSPFTWMILQEIASGRDFEVGLKLNDGSDQWRINAVDQKNLGEEIIVDRQTLAM